MKACRICKEIKPITTGFYKAYTTNDGHSNMCKECANKYTHMYRQDPKVKARRNKRHIERYRTDEKYRNTHLLRGKRYYQVRREQSKQYNEKYRNDFPERIIAQTILYASIKSGETIRPLTCSKCNKKCIVEGHHPDYSKPFDVVWLCRSCHRILHNKKNHVSH